MNGEPLSPDAAARSTDTDALVSRSSAASLGYLVDPFASLFLPPSLRRSTEKRPPLINIGTHARTWAVDALVDQFLAGGSSEKGKRRQVLSLGAGTDTRYWRKRAKALDKGEEWCCKWVEVDFEEATGGKARTISGKKVLKDALGGEVKIEKGGTGLSSPSYVLLPADLRDLAPLATALLSPSADRPPILDPTLPTLLLAECVLVYLPPANASELLSWVASTFAEGSAVSYDPFGLQDSFGKVMLRNLAARNLSLPSAPVTPTLDSLSKRLLSAGFSAANSLSVAKIRASVIPAEEIARVAKIEMIDEVEELNLVLEHYAITWGSVGAPKIGLQTR